MSDQRKDSVSHCVEQSITKYLEDLDGHEADYLYEMVLNEVEQPLLKVVMQHTNSNITKAAEILGMNRGTLRKKLKKYGIE